MTSRMYIKTKDENYHPILDIYGDFCVVYYENNELYLIWHTPTQLRVPFDGHTDIEETKVLAQLLNDKVTEKWDDIMEGFWPASDGTFVNWNFLKQVRLIIEEWQNEKI